MVGRLSIGAALVAAIFVPTAVGQDGLAIGTDLPPAPREFRGAWVATVDNIDWPSRPGLPVEQQRAELDRILDRAVAMRLNALVFQVRPACDAMYRSSIEPWSEFLTGAQGRAPAGDWDPLAHAIDGAQRRGLELHAWLNPFRARHRAARTPIVDDHPAKAWMVEHGDELWLDPGIPEARAHSLRVALDIVERYDVDGIHLDDYFYPYPIAGRAFPDDQTFARYRDGGGSLSKRAWRRSNVDAFVATLHREIKARKRWVKFGISPFGIVRPGVPSGIEAGIDQYDDLAADVLTWLREGWCDYIVPQLYWPIDRRAQSYRRLLDYWAGVKPPRVHLWIGNYASKAVEGEAGWSVAELVAQIELTRAEPRASGNVHFSMKPLRDDLRGLRSKLREGVYELPALVPASPWLDADPPAAPGLRIEFADGDLEVRWTADEDARWRGVYVRSGSRWFLLEAVGRKPGIAITRKQLERLGATAIAVSSIDRCGNESPRVLRELGN